MSEQATNVYAPPSATTENFHTNSPMTAELEAARVVGLSIESHVKAAGMLSYIGVAGYLGLLVSSIIPTVVHRDPAELNLINASTSILGGVLIGAASYHLRRIRKLGRTLYVVHFVFSVLSMVLTSTSIALSGAVTQTPGFGKFFIPLAVAAYLFGPKGAVVFADTYQQQVLPATPHLNARTAWWGWILPVLMVAGLMLGFIAGYMKQST